MLFTVTGTAMALVALPAGADAQHQNMPGMTMPMPANPTPKKPASKKQPAAKKKTAEEKATSKPATAPTGHKGPARASEPAMTMPMDHSQHDVMSMPMPAVPRGEMPMDHPQMGQMPMDRGQMQMG